MCGGTADPQHHFYLLLHALPRQYFVLQVSVSDSSFTLESVHPKPSVHTCEDKELTKNVTEVESH